MRILLIDDTRRIEQVHKFHLDKNVESYVISIARNFVSGLVDLKSGGIWDILYLDHDLGDFLPALDGGPDIEFTGMDILKGIQAGTIPKPGKIILVTSNASVRQSMQLIVDRIYEGKE